MKVEHIFHCPECKGNLTANLCEYNCAHQHGPFLKHERGFIQFCLVDDYFDKHWSLNDNAEIPESKLLGAKKFLEPLLNSECDNVLDFGAGDGVHLTVLSDLKPEAHLFGVDISASGLASCKRRVPQANLILADGANIPIADDKMSATFSFGVLGYMTNPWDGLAEMVRVTRRGGLVGVWMYPKTTTLMGRVLSIFRLIVPRLPYFLQARVADLIVPFLGLLPTVGKLHLGNASWRSCREVILVNIAPAKLYFPTRSEIIDELTSLGCRIVADDREAPFSIWATKE